MHISVVAYILCGNLVVFWHGKSVLEYLSYVLLYIERDMKDIRVFRT